MEASQEYATRVLDEELDELLAELAAIAIEGVKAVGKTETAVQRASTVHELDDLDERAIAAADVDRLLAEPPPVLIDEWQHLPQVWDRSVARSTQALPPAASC